MAMAIADRVQRYIRPTAASTGELEKVVTRRLRGITVDFTSLRSFPWGVVRGRLLLA